MTTKEIINNIISYHKEISNLVKESGLYTYPLTELVDKSKYGPKFLIINTGVLCDSEVKKITDVLNNSKNYVENSNSEKYLDAIEKFTSLIKFMNDHANFYNDIDAEELHDDDECMIDAMLSGSILEKLTILSNTLKDKIEYTADLKESVDTYLRKNHVFIPDESE